MPMICPRKWGCWSDDDPEARRLAQCIDRGDVWVNETCWDDMNSPAQAAVALGRVLRHRQRLLALNPLDRMV